MQLYLGDCLDVLRTLPDNSVDSVVTDPPYGLSFMGRKWDYDVPSVEIWTECLRVLKPGGHLLAFAGTRTQHRMCVRIEDAGFEIRDMIAWVYGSGFPKSLDVSKAIDKAAGAEREVVGVDPQAARRNKATSKFSGVYGSIDDAVSCPMTAPSTDAAKQWDGWGTALKPALEPITLARKPLIGTVAENVLAHGTGGLNIDGCRVEAPGVDLGRNNNARTSGTSYVVQKETLRIDNSGGLGRWPANLIHDGSDEVLAAFPNAPGQMAKASVSDTQRAGQNTYGKMERGPNGAEPRNDAGSAARFFYCAKASRKDRNEGCEDLISWENEDLSRDLEALRELRKVTLDDTTRRPNDTEWNTMWCGNESTERFLRAIKCIIVTMTKPTMSLETWNCSALSITKESIRDATKTSTETGLSLADCAEFLSLYLPSITCVKTGSVLGAALAAFETLLQTSKRVKRGNVHNTVKPTDLMAYLCRLVTPPGGVVLDPFMGSGSTGKAARREGFQFIGIERELEYWLIARARIDSTVNKT